MRSRITCPTCEYYDKGAGHCTISKRNWCTSKIEFIDESDPRYWDLD